MTTTNESPATGFETVVPGSSLGLGLGRIGRAAWTAMASVTRAMQISRMTGVLEQLSDWQLADIGLARYDVRDFSRWLVTGKGENRWHGAAGSSGLHLK